MSLSFFVSSRAKAGQPEYLILHSVLAEQNVMFGQSIDEVIESFLSDAWNVFDVKLEREQRGRDTTICLTKKSLKLYWYTSVMCVELSKDSEINIVKITF